MGARGAAIQGLMPFGSQLTYCMHPNGDGSLALDRDKLTAFAAAHRDSPVLVYGFTYILWQYLVKPLVADSVNLEMPNVHVLHSGGWKRLQDEAVDKTSFNRGVAQVFGCAANRVIDCSGMVENVGVIYPDCAEGNKHVPAFAEVIVRDPLTLEPVGEGKRGKVQVCSVLPTSFPGHLLLTEDVAELVALDGCRVRTARHGFSLRRTRAEGRDARGRQHRPEKGTGALDCGSMTDLIRNVDVPEDITSAAAELRRIVDTTSITPDQTLDVFEAWGSALGESDTADLAGVPFLRLWLRRNTLEPIIAQRARRGCAQRRLDRGRARPAQSLSRRHRRPLARRATSKSSRFSR